MMSSDILSGKMPSCNLCLMWVVCYFSNSRQFVFPSSCTACFTTMRSIGMVSIEANTRPPLSPRGQHMPEPEGLGRMLALDLPGSRISREGLVRAPRHLMLRSPMSDPVAEENLKAVSLSEPVYGPTESATPFGGTTSPWFPSKRLRYAMSTSRQRLRQKQLSHLASTLIWMSVVLWTTW